jgi:hypothetical protein
MILRSAFAIYLAAFLILSACSSMTSEEEEEPTCNVPELSGQISTGEIYYVSSSGDDSHACAQATPCKTILRTIERAEAGSTIKVAPGTYRLQDETLRLASNNNALLKEIGGEENKSITIEGAGKDMTIITAAIAEFENPDPDSWELVAPEVADPALNIYVSKEMYPDYFPENHSALWSVSEGKSMADCDPAASPSDCRKYNIWGYDENDFALIGYKEKDSFFSTNTSFIAEDKDDFQFPVYVGPGMYVATSADSDLIPGRIYIRLTITDPEKFNVTQEDQNPNHRSLRIFDRFDVLHSAGSFYLRWTDLSFQALGGVSLGILSGDNRTGPTHHWDFLRVKTLMHKFEIRDEAHHVNVFSSDISSGFPPWTYRSDVKFGYPSFPPARHLHLATLGVIGFSHDVKIQGNKISRSWFGVYPAEAYNVEISNNAFEGQTNDAVLIWHTAYDINVHHNDVKGTSGISFASTGYKESPATLGAIYVHHNDIELETNPIARPPADEENGYRYPWDKGKPDTDFEFTTNRAFGSHGVDPEPWNIYNNTIVMNSTKSHTGLLLSLEESETTRYFLNNIIIQENSDAEFVVGQTNNVGIRFGESHGRQISDGNVYWWPYGKSASADFYYLMRFYEDGNPSTFSCSTRKESYIIDSAAQCEDYDNTNSKSCVSGSLGVVTCGLAANDTCCSWEESSTPSYIKSFDSIEAFKNGEDKDGNTDPQLYELTKLHYPAGFDAHTVFADPELDQDKRPTSNGPAGSAQVNLSSYADWPDNDSDYIGAYPPDGSVLSAEDHIGVCNPPTVSEDVTQIPIWENWF